MRHLQVPDRPDEPTPGHRPGPNQCGAPPAGRSTPPAGRPAPPGAPPRRDRHFRTRSTVTPSTSYENVYLEARGRVSRASGERGIRTPGTPGVQRFSRPPHSAALSSLHAHEPSPRASPDTTTPPGAAPAPGTGVVVLTTARPRPGATARPGRGPRRRRPPERRAQPLPKNPRLRLGWADAGIGEAGLSRRPSASACPMAGHTGRRDMRVACRAW